MNHLQNLKYSCPSSSYSLVWEVQLIFLLMSFYWTSYSKSSIVLHTFNFSIKTLIIRFVIDDIIVFKIWSYGRFVDNYKGVSWKNTRMLFMTPIPLLSFEISALIWSEEFNFHQDTSQGRATGTGLKVREGWLILKVFLYNKMSCTCLDRSELKDWIFCQFTIELTSWNVMIIQGWKQ